MRSLEEIRQAERLFSQLLNERTPVGPLAMVAEANVSGIYAALHWVLDECQERNQWELVKMFGVNIIRLQAFEDQAEAKIRDQSGPGTGGFTGK